MFEINLPLRDSSEALPPEGWYDATIDRFSKFQQWENAQGKFIREEDLDNHDSSQKTFRKKFKVVFLLDQIDPETGTQYEVKSQPFNLTAKAKSSFRPFLEMIDPELVRREAHFREDLILGKRVKIRVTHHTAASGKTWPNIAQIVDLPTDKPEDIPAFKRG